MLGHPQTLVATENLSFWDKQARNLVLKLLNQLPQGSLLLKENDQVLGLFGARQSALNAEINVLDLSFYRKLLSGGSIAAGETYTQQMWTTPDLTKVIRLFARNINLLDKLEAKFSWLTSPFNQLFHRKNRNSSNQAKKNIEAHYDLGNELYTRFLDNSMMYSAAIYPSPEASLAEAQQHKLKTICDKLQLSENDHLLEIGTGWGGLAIFAAKHYGCKVTTTTISEEQYAWAEQQVEKQGLQQQITLLKKDYRLLEGEYDKLVSIEMIEAVGKEYLPDFFRKCQQLLKTNGLMLLQSITINDQRYESYSKGVDFIQRYIFPGGFLPSVLVLSEQVKQHTDMVIRDCHDIGLHYARTLQDWQNNFNQKIGELNQLGYDQQFERLWNFYFSYCEGGFLERTISTVQLVMTRPGHRDALFR